jgi:hypothetical protein
MRALFIGVVLGVILLAAMSFRAQRSRQSEAQAHAFARGGKGMEKKGGQKAEGGDDLEASWVVSGTWKKLRKEAFRDALKAAREKVTAYFHGLEADRWWSPSEFYVRHYLIQDLRSVQEMPPESKKDVIGTIASRSIEGRWIIEETHNFDKEENGKWVGKMSKVWLKVAVTQTDLRDMDIQDHKFQVKQLETQRERHAEKRMLVAARILGCLVALFAVVAGYIRLDEFTKGFYTGWLRLAGGVLLTVVGVGLWCLA